MTLLTLLLVALSVAGCPPPRSARARRGRCPKVPLQRCLPPQHQIVDLTHMLHADMPVRPGGVPFAVTRLFDHADGYRTHKLEMGDSIGTHVDAPLHFVPGGRGLERLQLSELVVPLVVVDMREKVAHNPDYQLSANDLVDWEGAHGAIPVGSLLILNSGWHTRFAEPKRYLNQDAEGVMHFPGIGVDAAQLLLERDVAGVGIDTLSIDYGASKDFATHKLMLAADKYQIENLANLDVLPPVGATVVVAVLPIEQGTQAPARVIALVPEPIREEEEDEE